MNTDNLQSPDDRHEGEENAKLKGLTEKRVEQVIMDFVYTLDNSKERVKGAAASIYKAHREEIEKMEKEISDAKEEIASLRNQIRIRDEQIDKIIQNH